jgi:hypothetical protein
LSLSLFASLFVSLLSLLSFSFLVSLRYFSVTLYLTLKTTSISHTINTAFNRFEVFVFRRSPRGRKESENGAMLAVVETAVSVGENKRIGAGFFAPDKIE